LLRFLKSAACTIATNESLPEPSGSKRIFLSVAFVSVDEFQRSCLQELSLFRLVKTNFDFMKYTRMEFSIGTGSGQHELALLTRLFVRTHHQVGSVRIRYTEVG
jgi:hypothetical protein